LPPCDTPEPKQTVAPSAEPDPGPAAEQRHGDPLPHETTRLTCPGHGPSLSSPDAPDPAQKAPRTPPHRQPIAPEDAARHDAREQDAGRALAHHADLTRAEVARCLPSGSRRIRNQAEALRVGLTHPDLETARPEFRRRLEDWWRIHVNYASWGGRGKPPCGVSSPGRATVCRLSGLPMSVSTYKNCRRWWEARGFVAIVRPGWTPLQRVGVLLDPEKDHCTSQAYVLCIPRRARSCAEPALPDPDTCGKTPQTISAGNSGPSTCPLSGSSNDPDRFPARARKEKSTTGTLPKTGKTGAPRSPLLRRGTLRTLTDGWWAHITRPFTGWPAADIVWAIDHLPDGRQHRMQSGTVRSPAGWLRWRLSHWLAADGTAMPSPSRARADRARRHRELLQRQDSRLGLSAAAARLRAVDGAYNQAGNSTPQQPQHAPRRPLRPQPRLAGWAARNNVPAPATTPRTARCTDPEWDAAVAAAAAAAAAVKAEETAGRTAWEGPAS
jgi:hypothetical protein